MFHRLCLAILPLAVIPTAPAQSETMLPIKNWNVDYRDDRCLASRDYGNRNKPITLGVRPSPNGETYELLIALPHSGPAHAMELKASVDFGKEPIQAWLLSYATADGKSNLYQSRISAAEMAQTSPSPPADRRA